MRIMTRTLAGSALQTALLLNLPYTPVQNSTLNEKFNIQSRVGLDGKIPTVKYICIGNNGHDVITGADGIAYTAPVNHRATDAALFNHIPFLVRKTTEDLTVAQRANYALRRVETINGVDYVFYYLKRVDSSAVAMQLQQTTVSNGESTTRPFTYTSDSLSPQQPDLPNNNVITTDGTYLSASAITPISFSEADVNELINVARVIYGDENRAIISEIGLCSGVDKVVSATGTSGQFNYTEAVGVQIATHITGYYPIGFSNKGFTLQLETGATEPLLGEGVRAS